MLDGKQFKKLTTLEIPEYIYQVQISKSRNVKYFHQNSGRGKVKKELKDIPKKYKATSYDLLGYALDDKGQKIIANPIAAGTAKYVPINGQVFYSSSGKFTRAKIVTVLHDYFKEILEEVKFKPFVKTDYPIVIQLEWFAPYNHKTMDVTNMASVYMKTFEDTLTNNGYIVDDEVRYVSGGFPIYTPVDTFENRKIIFTFYQDLRAEIKQLKLIQ
jgi:Holliday junction resolvase RusA-like endonuclease